MTDEPKQDAPAPIGEIELGPSKFDQFLDRHHKKLIIGGIVATVAIAGTYIFTELKQKGEEDAGAALIAALSEPTTPAERSAQIRGLVEGELAGKAAAPTAQLFLALEEWNAQEYDKAIATLEEFLASSPEHPQAPAAMVKLASFQHSNGKTEEAKKTYTSILDTPGAEFAAPHALLSLGDIAVAEGDFETARTQYKKIQSEYSDSPLNASGFQQGESVVAGRLRAIDTPQPTPYTPEPPKAPAAEPATPSSGDAPQPPVPAIPPAPVTPAEPAPVVPATPLQPATPPAPAETPAGQE